MNVTDSVFLLVVMLVLAAVPSASVALVVVRSATHGFAHGAAVALGIVLADVLFALLAILGMTVIAETMGSLFAIVKILGGGYLIWVGVSLLRAPKPKPISASGSAAAASWMASLAAGFVLTLGDLKAILFYASLFPAFVNMQSLAPVDIGLILIVTVLAVGGVKLIYAYAARRIVGKLSGRVNSALPRRLAGCAMIGSGAYLVSKS
ncbi:LysE family translocator [Cerasicoccus fimbriatus]|uniref:LysE family translocator n=1 Tax=Cerasicoccus fimbriatus TaxID=3014554 RepID=UPI0022B4BD13|nr:LysE family translocator [Cerasicoccus sp. TK19100]